MKQQSTTHHFAPHSSAGRKQYSNTCCMDDISSCAQLVFNRFGKAAPVAWQRSCWWTRWNKACARWQCTMHAWWMWRLYYSVWWFTLAHIYGLWCMGVFVVDEQPVCMYCCLGLLPRIDSSSTKLQSKDRRQPNWNCFARPMHMMRRACLRVTYLVLLIITGLIFFKPILEM